eukprot:4898837-Prymnesium_polylepis.1
MLGSAAPVGPVSIFMGRVPRCSCMSTGLSCEPDAARTGSRREASKIDAATCIRRTQKRAARSSVGAAGPDVGGGRGRGGASCPAKKHS